MAKLEFAIDKIMSVTDARNNFNKIVDEVEKDPEGKYLLTKGGKPSVVMVNADYLEKLTGDKTTQEAPTKKESEINQPTKTPPETPAQETPIQQAPRVSPTSPSPPPLETPPTSPQPPSEQNKV